MSDAHNPFEAPEVPVAPSAEVHDVAVDASSGQRLANFFVDYLVSSALNGALGFALGMLGAAEFLGGLTGMVFGLLTTVAYYVLLEGTTGRTVGKYVTGTQVVRDDGGPVTWGAVIGRSFARFVPFEPFSFLGGEGRGWHDTWTSTRVVDVRKPRGLLEP